MSRDYLNPDRPIRKHGDQLPHWQQGEVMQFVTFRLGDALPMEKVHRWKEQSNTWKNTWPPPWTKEQEEEYHRLFTAKLERWLDQGAGTCILRDGRNRRLVEGVLMRFHGERVHHHARVIMPNHLHLLFTPLAPLDKLLQAWKSVSAKAIGKGSIWQPNYRDTLIRDGDHFANAVRYIRRNPAKANLRDDEFTLWEGERAMAVK